MIKCFYFNHHAITVMRFIREIDFSARSDSWTSVDLSIGVGIYWPNSRVKLSGVWYKTIGSSPHWVWELRCQTKYRHQQIPEATMALGLTAVGAVNWIWIWICAPRAHRCSINHLKYLVTIHYLLFSQIVYRNNATAFSTRLRFQTKTRKRWRNSSRSLRQRGLLQRSGVNRWRWLWITSIIVTLTITTHWQQ